MRTPIPSRSIALLRAPSSPTKGCLSLFNAFSSVLIFPRYSNTLATLQNLTTSESKSSLNESLRSFTTQQKKKKKKSGSKKQKERIAKKSDLSTKATSIVSFFGNVIK